MNSPAAVVKYVRLERVMIGEIGTLRNPVSRLAMGAKSVRAFGVSAAPDLEIVVQEETTSAAVDADPPCAPIWSGQRNVQVVCAASGPQGPYSAI
jgi:hypothetical protein